MPTTRPARRIALLLLGLPTTALALLAATAAPAAATTSAATAAADGCAGAASLSTVSSQYTPTPFNSATIVRSIRAAHHVGCDRIVFDFTGPVPAYSVGYVRSVVQDASGRPVPLSGSAFLRVVIHPTNNGDALQPNIRWDFPVLRQLRGAGDFEGVVSYGVGLASRQPFLAYRLTNPSRLVIDIHAPAGGQVSRVPTGGVETGGGAAAGAPAGSAPGDGRPPVWPLAAGLLALVTVTMLVITRRRTRSWAH